MSYGRVVFCDALSCGVCIESNCHIVLCIIVQRTCFVLVIILYLCMYVNVSGHIVSSVNRSVILIFFDLDFQNFGFQIWKKKRVIGPSVWELQCHRQTHTMTDRHRRQTYKTPLFAANNQNTSKYRNNFKY